jgi:hypothetical protein
VCVARQSSDDPFVRTRRRIRIKVRDDTFESVIARALARGRADDGVREAERGVMRKGCARNKQYNSTKVERLRPA